jgi:hypothetical protein
MNILMPDEVERRNIITKKEIAATILALRYAIGETMTRPANHTKVMRDAMRKFERTLAEMKL